MTTNSTHLKYIGYVIEILRTGADRRINPNNLRGLLKSRFDIEATEEDLRAALQAIAPLVAETKKGLLLSPLATIEDRSSFYASRVKLNPAPKRSVAMHIYQHILEELDSVFLDAGSANGAIAEEMAYGDKHNFTVLTNNVRAVRIFLANRTIRTFVTGGVYDVEDEALVGERALIDWQGFGCKTAFVGVSAISTYYVYNHALTGEERIKAHYWQIPADQLVVPATLGKFKGQDASCFGRLFREQQRKPEIHPHETHNSANIYFIGKSAHDDWREGPSVEYNAPGFRAKKCTIVIEPEWMIDELYKTEPELKVELMSAVEQIKGERTRTKVDIVHARISKEELFSSYPALQKHFG